LFLHALNQRQHLIIGVLDRRRELGLWRALDLRGRQVAASVGIEVAVALDPLCGTARCASDWLVQIQMGWAGLPL